ncbi:MAG TPA: BamA/TamA family outer membrane protein, partial [Gemmatimonadales bacterium]|nr:BamA/TamA family outer membrane protein [Gemmatimonadales bacterium]
EGSGGDGYTRFTGAVRGYVPLREGTTLAARVAGTGITGDPPLNALFEIPTWGVNVIQAVGGVTSNRGYDFQRLTGEDVLLFNAEIRHDLLNLGDFGAFTLIGFFDAGRVFQGEPFKLTTEDMKVGAGGGLAIRVLRFTIWTFNFAGGSDGFKFTAGTGWAF